MVSVDKDNINILTVYVQNVCEAFQVYNQFQCGENL